MTTIKPSIPKGTRDFLPVESAKREFIFSTQKHIFEKYGYLPINTPSLENLSTLMGKYGEEGDRLIFKILNSGNFTNNIDMNLPSTQLASKICEKGLRYDLTVPFARFVVMHQNEISFPFKRYQIQPVWRADRPQKGRYREFYQCDIDVIGSDSILNELELVKIADELFNALKIRVVIKINNRKILAGIAEVANVQDKITDLCIIIDKLDKIGKENIEKELIENGFSTENIAIISQICNITSNNETKLNQLEKLLSNSKDGTKGINELKELMNLISKMNISSLVEFDINLARGLSYYTGAIFEIKALDVEIGSISGGGRYDNLTGIFGVKNMSGVGISFGAERIFDVMEELNLFPESLNAPIKVLFVNFGKKEIDYILPAIELLRKNNISCELYPDSIKIAKQLNYANAKNIRFAIIAGENEINDNVFTVKDMTSGEQNKLTLDNLLNYCK